MLNKSASQPEKPNQMLENNQNEDVNQTKVKIEPSPHSLREIEYIVKIIFTCRSCKIIVRTILLTYFDQIFYVCKTQDNKYSVVL